MNKYDYYAAVRADLLEHFKEEGYGHIQRNFFEEDRVSKIAYDEVTGRNNGSKFCNSWAAHQCLCGNWDLMQQAAEYFGLIYADEFVVIKPCFDNGPEIWDVRVRCYIFDCIFSKFLEEWNETHPAEDDADDESEEG